MIFFIFFLLSLILFSKILLELLKWIERKTRPFTAEKDNRISPFTSSCKAKSSVKVEREREATYTEGDEVDTFRLHRGCVVLGVGMCRGRGLWGRGGERERAR